MIFTSPHTSIATTIAMTTSIAVATRVRLCVADELQTNLSSSEQTGQKVALELADLKKKLREQRRLTDTANTNAQKFQVSVTHFSVKLGQCQRK